MSSALFPNLFEPIQVGCKTIKNRIMSTGHDTSLSVDGSINKEYVAYQESRARGGAGLVVLQVSAVHESARYSSHVLMATDDKFLPGYQEMAETCHKYGCTVFAQIFHPGREIMETADGLEPVAYSASAIPQERFHVMPRPLTKDIIEEIVEGYAQSALRLKKAGIDGAEIVASHGYLPAQFLNPNINKRDDEYGGSAENRLRFLRDVIARTREVVGDDFVVGLRISSREMDDQGLDMQETIAACKEVSSQLDYVNVIAGTSASLGGSVHIVPPMTVENAYVAPDSKLFKEALDIPVFVGGRINQPQEAETVLAKGEADVVGMTRALICDPLMPTKAMEGRFDDIRACIACNQACIGHFHRGLPISCIQHPETGRELQFGFDEVPKTQNPKKVMIVGAGPGGLKAASIAALAGHDVTLHEATSQIGGQVLLAQKLPQREEFGGLATNLLREVELAGAKVIKNSRVTREMVAEEKPDAVIIATGARPYVPEFENMGDMQVVTAWDVLNDTVKVGGNVVVADWKCDWIGMGVSELLASKGHTVKLCANGLFMGERLQSYVRTEMVAALHRLGVETHPYMRLFGCDDDTVYMQHTASNEAVLFEGIDTLVLSQGHLPNDDLKDQIADLCEVHLIGDALVARTAEEAVFEGLKTAWAL
ncbi:FAD-dependent oxidoreductase [Terasakiella pusilla]|uniref:oxidoreductase n=1 Tax=Terasakiella pusilla TaxID=64973 RepID=UPI003AA8C057